MDGLIHIGFNHDGCSDRKRDSRYGYIEDTTCAPCLDAAASFVSKRISTLAERCDGDCRPPCRDEVGRLELKDLAIRISLRSLALGGSD